MTKRAKAYLGDFILKALAGALGFCVPMGLMLFRKYFRETLSPAIELVLLVMSGIGIIAAGPLTLFFYVKMRKLDKPSHGSANQD